MNPCPCGYFGDLKRECRCGPLQVQRYRQRISGPLLDRIDLHIEVPAVEYRDIASTRSEEASAAIRDRVGRAREQQEARFRSDKKINCQELIRIRHDRTESQRPRLRSHPESLSHCRRPRRLRFDQPGTRQRSHPVRFLTLPARDRFVQAGIIGAAD